MRANWRKVNSLSFANIQCISRLSLERYAYPADSLVPERRRAIVPPFPDEIFRPILEPRFATSPERTCLSSPWIHSATIVARSWRMGHCDPSSDLHSPEKLRGGLQGTKKAPAKHLKNLCSSYAF